MSSFRFQNILAVDVEDWYHPEYVRNKVTNRTDRVIHNINLILKLLKKHNNNASFFLVGEIAEKNPEIITKIIENNHEVSFHGYNHQPLWNKNPKMFREELERFNDLIYSLIHRKCLGYRAPSYSLDQSTSWALDILERQGYIYDASIFPIKTPLYGVTGSPLIPYRPSHTDITKIDKNRRFFEFPALVRDLKIFKIPAAGGFFLRLLPLKIIENAIESMNHSGYPAVISVHPWEIDNNTPRLKLGLFKSFVTYHNLENMINKFEKLLSKYKFSSFSSYIENYLKI